MPDYRNTADAQGQQNLMQALAAIQKAGQANSELNARMAMPGIENKAASDRETQQQLVKQNISSDNLKQLLEAANNGQLPQGAGATMDGAAITRQPNIGVLDLKKQQQEAQQVNKYSAALKPTSDFLGAAQELERVTNRDGKGGIFTNPGAQLTSAGKIASAIPDAGIGIAEMTGILPKGSAEERKALLRYNQAVGVALGGARGMSPAIQAGIKQSMGQITSGDPQLVSKAVRGSARGIGQVLRTAQSGFSPEIRAQAHTNAQMEDPMEFFNHISPEGDPAVNLKSPPAGNAQQIQQQLNPKAAPAPGGFDPDAYLKGN